MYIFTFIIGLIIGSFLNVIIYRLPLNDSIVLPSSHCPNCKTRLKFFDLIPVISYIFTKGKCRYCGEKISLIYPIVEILTALLFLLTFLKYGLNTEFVIMLILISSLIVVSFIDLKYQIIPNIITFSFIPMGLILAIIFSHITFINSLLGLIIPAGILLLIAFIYKKGMGIGDVKLIGMIGVFIGWKYALISIFIGALIGSAYGIYMMLTDKMTRKTKIPFGPFISSGAVIMILWGDVLINWYVGFFL